MQFQFIQYGKVVCGTLCAVLPIPVFINTRTFYKVIKHAPTASYSYLLLISLCPCPNYGPWNGSSLASSELPLQPSLQACPRFSVLRTPSAQQGQKKQHPDPQPRCALVCNSLLFLESGGNPTIVTLPALKVLRLPQLTWYYATRIEG